MDAAYCVTVLHWHKHTLSKGKTRKTRKKIQIHSVVRNSNSNQIFVIGIIESNSTVHGGGDDGNAVMAFGNGTSDSYYTHSTQIASASKVL